MWLVSGDQSRFLVMASERTLWILVRGGRLRLLYVPYQSCNCLESRRERVNKRRNKDEYERYKIRTGLCRRELNSQPDAVWWTALGHYDLYEENRVLISEDKIYKISRSLDFKLSHKILIVCVRALELAQTSFNRTFWTSVLWIAAPQVKC